MSQDKKLTLYIIKNSFIYKYYLTIFTSHEDVRYKIYRKYLYET